MPYPLGRETEDKDYVKDALIARILLEALEHRHKDVKDELLEYALSALVEIMKIEGVDLKEYFYGSDDRRQATLDALSELVISGALFTKTRNDGRHYFESSLRHQAEVMVEKDLSKEMRDAAQKAMDTVMQILMANGDWQKRVAAYKTKKEMMRSEVPSA